MALEDRISDLERRVAALEGATSVDPVAPIGRPVVPGARFVEELTALKDELGRSPDAIDREFAEMIPNAVLVYDEVDGLNEQTREFIRLNCERATIMAAQLGGSEATKRTFTWVAHPVVNRQGWIGFFRTWDFDFSHGEIKGVLAHRLGVKLEDVAGLWKERLEQYRRERIVDSNDFSPGK